LPYTFHAFAFLAFTFAEAAKFSQSVIIAVTAGLVVFASFAVYALRSLRGRVRRQLAVDAGKGGRYRRRIFDRRTAGILYHSGLGFAHMIRRVLVVLFVILAARASAQDKVPYGQTRLGLSDEGRDGTLYIPKSYKPGTPMPLLVMLHGFSGWGDNQRSLFALAEELGFIVVTPESRDITWGKEAPGFDQDVRYIGAAFRHVGSIVNVDFDRVALGGQSDGAGYALTDGARLWRHLQSPDRAGGRRD
jgi:hypothetical protein